jgi:putative flippase GtrA
MFFLIVANALATLLRFLLFRGWVFRSRSRAAAADRVLQMETAA